MARLLVITVMLFVSGCGNSLSDLIVAKRPDIYNKMDKNQLAAKSLRGDSEAQFRFAKTLCCGSGPNFDNKAAYQLLCHAAKNGHIESQYTLGLMFAEGLPMSFSGKNNTGFLLPKDLAKAHMWVSIASQNNFKKANKAKKSLTKQMSRQQINESFMLRRNWQSTNCNRVG